MKAIFILISLSLIFAQTPIIGGDDHDKVPHGPVIGGDDHDRVPHGPVIGGDDHDKVPHGPIIGGDDHDKVPHGPIIGGDDHDKVPHGHKFGGDDHDKVAYKIITLTNFLNSKDLPELKEYALKVENWKRTVKGEIRLGGLHDYVDRLGKDEVISYILDSSMKYPELLDQDAFMKVITSESTEDPIIGGDDHDKVAYKIITLTNFLNSKDLPELKEYALKVENWKRTVKEKLD